MRIQSSGDLLYVLKRNTSMAREDNRKMVDKRVTTKSRLAAIVVRGDKQNEKQPHTKTKEAIANSLLGTQLM